MTQHGVSFLRSVFVTVSTVFRSIRWRGHKAGHALLLALGVCLLVPAAAQAQWTQRVVSGPAPRFFSAMTYDAARGVTVLFGGVTTVGNGETWEWNGTAWTQRVVSGPSPRAQHAMAYDAARGVTVLFGGLTSGPVNGETWEWNGTAWTQRSSSGPSPRAGHAMAYDAARGVTVLFGGQTNGVPNGDTWEWNGTAWTQRAVSGPSPRAYHAIAYDSARGVTVLFGGTVGAGMNGENWEWNGTVWTLRASGPSPRDYHKLVYDVARGVTVLFGGTSGAQGQTWEWNGTAWTQRMISGPAPARNYPAMAYDAARGTTVLFGGLASPNALGDTWELDGGVPCVPPSITTQPSSITLCTGTSATFTVAASGTPAPTFQWRKNGVNIGGASGASYTIASVAAADAGNYDCIVTNACGNATSNAAALTVNAAPSVTTQPSSLARCLGASATFTVATSGTPAPTYQWRKDGVDISGETAASYTIASVTLADAANYDCVLVNSCGSTTSNAATLTVNVAPSITTQPVSLVRCPSGSSATFTVAASGDPAPTYQWRKEGVDIGGATSPSYTIASVIAPDGGNYDCVVTNSCGSATSDTATLTVCFADFNCNGVVTSQDFFDFLVAFFAENPIADVNHDGFVTSQDFFDFITAFFSPCP